MPKKTARELVVDALEQQLLIAAEECTPGAYLRTDLGADSLDVIELTMQFEEELDIQIDDAECEAVKTVADLTALIAKKANLDGVEQAATAN